MKKIEEWNSRAHAKLSCMTELKTIYHHHHYHQEDKENMLQGTENYCMYSQLFPSTFTKTDPHRYCDI